MRKGWTMQWRWIGLALVVLVVLVVFFVLVMRGRAGTKVRGRHEARALREPAAQQQQSEIFERGAESDRLDPDVSSEKTGRRVGAASDELADPYGGRGETSYRDRELSAQSQQELRDYERSQEGVFDEQDREQLRRHDDGHPDERRLDDERRGD